MKGNEQDCICEKPNGKHRKRCDAYRLSEFEKKIAHIKMEHVDKDGNILESFGHLDSQQHNCYD